MGCMRRARMKVPGDRPAGYYHCVSRVVDRQWIFEPAVKQEFLRLMREFEAFCEVRVLTYCLMSNHFHILVEVPRPPEIKPTAEQVLEKLARLTGHQDVGAARQQLELFRQRGDVDAEGQWLARYHARMWDVSAFMKLLKQRFTQWYNGCQGTARDIVGRSVQECAGGRR